MYLSAILPQNLLLRELKDIMDILDVVIQEGDYIENRVTYPEINAVLRSDE